SAASAQRVPTTASASDSAGVTRVEFYDGTTLKSTATTAPYVFAWAFTGTDNGAHSWTAKAYDAAGNSSASAAVVLTVSIDTVAPARTSAGPGPSPDTCAPTLTLN